MPGVGRSVAHPAVAGAATVTPDAGGTSGGTVGDIRTRLTGTGPSGTAGRSRGADGGSGQPGTSRAGAGSTGARGHGGIGAGDPRLGTARSAPFAPPGFSRLDGGGDPSGAPVRFGSAPGRAGPGAEYRDGATSRRPNPGPHPAAGPHPPPPPLAHGTPEMLDDAGAYRGRSGPRSAAARGAGAEVGSWWPGLPESGAAGSVPRAGGGPWPELPDDRALWTPAGDALDPAHLRRLDREQAGA